MKMCMVSSKARYILEYERVRTESEVVWPRCNEAPLRIRGEARSLQAYIEGGSR